MKEYFDVFNLFLKFNGNVQFVKLVEGDTLLKYKTFVKAYKDFFPNGIKKNKRNEVYKKENLDDENYNEVIKYYEKLRKHIDNKKDLNDKYMLKLVEEVGELAEVIRKNKRMKEE